MLEMINMLLINAFVCSTVDCIWKYMACARSTSTDAECKSEFNQCSMGPLIAGDAANT